MLRYDNVTVTNSNGFGNLKNVSLELPSGSLTVVIGSSGAGKSSLIDVGAGLKRCNSGRVLVENKEISQMNSKSYFSFLKATAILKKKPRLIERFNVYENIRLPLLLQGHRAKYIRLETTKALEYLGLRHKELSPIKELNTSQKMRINLAQCLVRKPRLLLANDPTFNLSSDDFDNFREFLYTLKDIGTTILVVMDSSRVGKLKNAKMKTLWRGELIP